MKERIRTQVVDWIEKTDWIREWVTKEITRKRTVWKMQFFPFAGGGKLAKPAMSTLLILATLLGISLSVVSALTLCSGPSDISPTPTPTSDKMATAVANTHNCGTHTAVAATQTAQVGTATPAPTVVPTPGRICHIVEAGDTLTSIAKKYGTVIDQLGVTSSNLSIGQEICFELPALPPPPSGSVMYTATETSCQNIAASFGLTVAELVEYNLNRPHTDGANYTLVQNGGECTIQPGAQLVIPTIPLYEPSHYVDLYLERPLPHPCVSSGSNLCLSPNDSPELMIAHTLFGEGGSSISGQSSRNVMQVALNRINAYLAKRGKSASDYSREDFTKLLVRVMAQPYDTEAGYSEPAFNAFSEPYPHHNTPKQANWDETLGLVQSILDSNGQSGTGAEDPLINPDVTTYCSQDIGFSEPEPSNGIVGREISGDGTRIQFYFNDGRAPNCHK